MKLTDCAFPFIAAVAEIYTDINAAFKDANVVFLVGSMPRKQGMERADLLEANMVKSLVLKVEH